MKKRKQVTNKRLQVIGSKLVWFKENLDNSVESYTPQQVIQLFEK